MNMNSILSRLAILFLSCMPAILFAWPAPVDFSADKGDNTDFHRYTLQDNTTQYDRCDTKKEIYEKHETAIPKICHRWGLVFEKGKVEIDWKPNINNEDNEDNGAKYRLPTIKELVRLYNYADPDNAQLDPVIKNMLVDEIDANIWLISSSYRDLDGSYDVGKSKEGRLQIFALNALTGEVRAFEPGQKSSGVPALKLCVSLQSNGNCVLDQTDTTIHAIKVNQTLLKDL